MRRIAWILAGVFITTLAFGAFHLSGNAFAAPLAAPICTSPGCVIYDLKTQSACTQVNESPTYQTEWRDSMSTNTDQRMRKGEIVAYKIQWSTGWSDWYVTGVNDIDWKVKTDTNDMRRVWSYFYDHNHTYIICTN